MCTGLCIQDSIECFFLLIGRSDYPFLKHYAWGNTLFCFPQNICAFVPCSTYFIVTYNLKFCFPLMASSMQFSSKALYRESGPSRDGDPVQGNLPFCLNFFLTFFRNDMSLFPFHTNLTNSVECLCILAFSLHYIRDCFLSLITSSPFSLKLKLGKCIGPLLKILLFFDDSFLFPILYQAYK